jgi:integrase
MGNEIEKVEAPGSALGQVADTARDYIRASKAKNTLRAYKSDWCDFQCWCAGYGLSALPASPETVALYVTALADGRWVTRLVKGRKVSKFEKCKVSTISRRIVSIGQAHAIAGHPSPTGAAEVRHVMAGIRKTKGTARAAKKATLVDDIRRMMNALPSGTLGVRDRALLLVCFAGAFRRSEVVSLDRGDCMFTGDGLVVTLRRSKTDQEGEGRKIAVPYGSSPDTCPVRALKAWLDLAGSADDAAPVFQPISRRGKILAGRLSDKAVVRAVKRYALLAGLDASKYAGHSLRAGLATAAAIGGASERSIMNQTGHKSVNMVRVYIRDGNLFRDNAAAKVGL